MAAPSFVQEFESPTPAPTVTTGNLLVCVFTYDGSSPVFSDGLGDSPFVICTEQVGADGGKTQVIGFKVTAGGSASIGMTQTGGSFWIVIGEEVTNQDPTTPVDDQSTIIVDAQTGDMTRTVTVDNVNGDDLLIGYYGVSIGGASFVTGGFTTDGGTNFGNILGHKTIADVGLVSVTFTAPGTQSCDGILVAIQGVQVAARPPRSRIVVPRFSHQRPALYG